jgi:phosphoribosylaminoimidazole-succinocarboxamide synthase
MEKREKLYEGKAKQVYSTDDPDLYIQYFKDDATAFDATKRGTIVDKGVINNKISATIFLLLEAAGVKTHFVKMLSDREMLVKKLEIVPVEVNIRNIVAGGMAKNLGLEEGIVLKEPVLEHHYKRDDLHDPLFNEYHIKALGLATDDEMKQINAMAFKVNDVTKKFFSDKGLDLVDFKLEFGRSKGEILLGDEFSPDTCRLWEKGTGRKMDKDRFRRDLGDVEQAYQDVLKIVTG